MSIERSLGAFCILVIGTVYSKRNSNSSNVLCIAINCTDDVLFSTDVLKLKGFGNYYNAS
jgi:hypothetical protein